MGGGRAGGQQRPRRGRFDGFDPTDIFGRMFGETAERARAAAAGRPQPQPGADAAATLTLTLERSPPAGRSACGCPRARTSRWRFPAP